MFSQAYYRKYYGKGSDDEDDDDDDDEEEDDDEENTEDEEESSLFIEKEKPRTFLITRLMAEDYGREMLIITTLREFPIYLIFLIVVVCAAVVSHSSSKYYLTRAMKGQFLEAYFRTVEDAQIQFADIKTANDFWNYAETIVSNSFDWSKWYDTENPVGTTHDDDKKILYENKIIGAVRLRQLMVRNDSCGIHDLFTGHFYSCYGRFELKHEAKAPFGPGDGSAWTYSNPRKIGGSPFTGKVAWYPGGGYYEDVPTDFEEAKAVLQSLKDNYWIQKGTRVIFVDFTVYNANLNLFCLCKIVFEFPPVGGIVPSVHIESLCLTRSNNIADIFVSIMEWCLLGFAVFYTLEEIREIIYYELKYVTLFWNYVDLTIIALLFTCFVLNTKRTATQKDVEKLVLIKSKYADFEPIAEKHIDYNVASAVLVFFAFMKLFKYLSLNRTLGQLNSTLRNCIVDILAFSVMFFIVFVAFAVLGYLLFGTKVYLFSSFGITMFTLLRTILGDFDYLEIERANRILAPIFVTLYIFFVFFILLNMFLAIVNDAYGDVKAENAAAQKEIKVVHYIKRSIIRPRRGKGSEDFDILKIGSTLEKCGFDEEEIDLFMDEYLGDSKVDDEIHEMKKSIVTAVKDTDKDIGLPIVRITDFAEQVERLQEIRQAVREVWILAGRLSDKMEYVDEAYKKQAEAKKLKKSQ